MLTRRLQSDRLENQFSQYRLKSGARILVDLREVPCSNKTLKFRLLLKAGMKFCTPDDLKPLQFSYIPEAIVIRESVIMDAHLPPDST